MNIAGAERMCGMVMITENFCYYPPPSPQSESGRFLEMGYEKLLLLPPPPTESGRLLEITDTENFCYYPPPPVSCCAPPRLPAPDPPLVGARVELKQEPVSPLIVIKNTWVILLTSGLLFDITTGLHLIVQLFQW